MSHDLFMNLDQWQVYGWIDALPDGTFRGRMLAGHAAGNFWASPMQQFELEPTFETRTRAITIMVMKACQMYG